ncbi:hypothetical protein KS461_09875 [Pseudomonas chlororaphis]|uniref:hypothetical protein n=1 Tax=Pseudomonas chlororaphis TaxID=587753 RepID=UPI00215A6236|nr:hypothetical protein [Pseudomonas chlororaphis]UVE48867.1 hypothetical protein KS461_09875 [Pseudomonas chlororaphis]
MSNNEMFSMPRDLAKRIISDSCDAEGAGEVVIQRDDREELRALLAAPAESCGACNGCTNGCRLERESPTAAQPLPPAMIDREGGHCVEHSRNHSDGCLDCALDHVTRLQAEVEEWRASNKANALAAGKLVEDLRAELDALKAQPKGDQSSTIRAAYEVIYGMLSVPEIAAKLDVPTVEHIAKRLNDLLPGAGETQPQGEPVAYLCKAKGSKWLQYGSTVHDPWLPGEVELTPLYASPPAPVARQKDSNGPLLKRNGDQWVNVDPAPVAVVLPERRKPKCTGSISDFTTFEEARGWNACLDEVARLNPGTASDEDWHMNPCKQGHRDVGAAGGVASCYQCDEKITAATTQEAFKLWNAAHPKL